MVCIVCRVVSIVGMVLFVSVVGLVVFPSLQSCDIGVWVIDTYDLGCSAVGCVWSFSSMLGLQLGVFGLWYLTPGILEL